MKSLNDRRIFFGIVLGTFLSIIAISFGKYISITTGVDVNSVLCILPLTFIFGLLYDKKTEADG